MAIWKREPRGCWRGTENSHNKTLAAQLYSEFRTFFPDNAVAYFVSYYDYYQPLVCILDHCSRLLYNTCSDGRKYGKGLT